MYRGPALLPGRIPTSVCGISDVIFTTFFSAALEKEEKSFLK